MLDSIKKALRHRRSKKIMNTKVPKGHPWRITLPPSRKALGLLDADVVKMDTIAKFAKRVGNKGKINTKFP